MPIQVLWGTGEDPAPLGSLRSLVTGTKTQTQSMWLGKHVPLRQQISKEGKHHIIDQERSTELLASRVDGLRTLR